MSMQASYTYTPDNLFAGSPFTISDQITLEASLSADITLERGTVLSLKANNKAVIVDSGVTGAEEPYAILADKVTVPQNTDKIAPVYLTGEFNENSLIFGGTDTPSTHKVAMRKIGMFIKKAVSA